MRNVFRNPFGPFKQARGWAAPKLAEPKDNESHAEPFDGNNMLLRNDVFKLPKLQPVWNNLNNWAVQGAALDADIRKMNVLWDQATMLWGEPNWARVPESKVPAIRELDSWSREFRIVLEMCSAVLKESNRLGVDMRGIGGDDLEFPFGDGNRSKLAELFNQQVKDAGMVVYGGGNFSIAFGKENSPRIYKWSIRRGDAGVHWNKLCKNKYHNSAHLPAVYELHEFGNGMILTQTERLLPKHQYEEQCAKPIDMWATDALSDMMCDVWNSAAFETVQKQFGTSAALCLQRIGLWKSKNNLIGDLHSENYMFREDGTVVFTDPVSYVRGGDPDVVNF